MNEIEVKAKLKDREKVIKHLKDLGAEFYETKYQKDTAYWPNDIKDLSTHVLGRNFLRIREQEVGGKKKIIFTLKQPQTNQTDCIEHEIKIEENDTPSMKSIISFLGYYKYVTIEKTRLTAKLNDIEVCIDDVVGLGSYIELEKFAPADSAAETQKELYAILESWGINKDDYVYDGYDVLVQASKNI